MSLMLSFITEQNCSEPLHLRRRASLLKQMYICFKLDTYVDTHNLRRGRSDESVRLKTCFLSNNIFMRSPFFEGPRLWRNLPREIKESETIESFKK